VTIEQQLALLSQAGWEAWHIGRSFVRGEWSVRIINPEAHRWTNGKPGDSMHDRPDVSRSMQGDTLQHALQQLIDDLDLQPVQRKIAPPAVPAIDLAALLR